ncbi:D-glycero-beta-D-manno-heptose 1-phosphate adenylyltransferase [Mucilaginibacter celer]|uniref:D-glycero-beta-D-manno-heptose 1-phosphate adenylyltransferase n=1 Tax=Mucilaginibacter celer TaxID=2305508 RepID=A0A494VVH4_9SPHI|nr:D-glycero-beta-D-manno-heptose 1-phosphate adenylyltransferase [Mucilaginibacter celer]AYL95265.1 D-glycero-beta-D-manno-heptose 1-phosphate adenylyltransferase [Mucilaginibacter celer]
MDSLDLTLADKIGDVLSLPEQINFWRSAKSKIVFTNGVFDLVHRGHLSYLAAAARLGDRLIVGINSDLSVKRIKGPERPINDQQSRAALLASLFYVDLVVVFDNDDPLSLITQVKPDILVKGADYRVEDIVGCKEVLAYGGEVKLIQFIEGHSSTLLIDKIRNKQHV